MKKNYKSPHLVETPVAMPEPILAGGSIENMQYGQKNVFGDDEDDVKERGNDGYGSEAIQHSLW